MQFSLFTLLSLAGLSFSIYGVSASPAMTVGAAINTTSGLIVGHADPSYPYVSEYLGIPFAKPPVNNLRFAAPVAYLETKRIVADTQPSSCPQSPAIRNVSEPQPEQDIDANKASFANNTSEDCLYLNVWTKFPNSCSVKKPVLVWFYGGGFHSGGASDNTQQGGIFAAEQDVVMVNFNYRVGVFGFSGAPGVPQNAGLLDQRLALEWVRDNIAAFGGDASRIIIMGHSAGGASVDYYTYAWMNDPIIAGAIPMSGTVTSFGRRTPETGLSAWDSTAALLGCGNSSTTSASAILACMQQKGTAAVYKASLEAEKRVTEMLPREDQVYIGVTGIFSPTIDNRTIFENYTVLGNEGRFTKVPVLTGSNIDEACLFSQSGQFPASDDPMLTDIVFTCPTHHAAEVRASAGIPVWKYSWLAGYPNENFPVCPGKPWHGSEVNVLFGSTEIASSGERATEKELANGFYFRQSVSAFAHNPARGLANALHWPQFGANENQVIELATNQTNMAVGNDATVAELCNTKLRAGGPNY